MSVVLKNGKRVTGRDYLTGNKHKVAPSNKKQTLPLGVSITWEHIPTTPTPALRLCIVDKYTGKRVKLGRGLVGNGIDHACFQIRNVLLLHDYEVPSLQILANQVKAVIARESSEYGFDPDWIIDFHLEEYI